VSSASAWSKRRLLVPRWKLFRSVLGTGELATSKERKQSSELRRSEHFLERRANWTSAQSLVTAAELIETAQVENLVLDEKVAEAAKHILEKEDYATASVKVLAANILRNNSSPGQVILSTNADSVRPRKEIAIDVRDPFAWLDLGLLQVKSRNLKAAKKSLDIAFSLAPTNRFVLRTLGRFYVHQADPERAHALISRCPATKYDPWLMSAEIAFATLAHKKVASAKIGLSVLTSGDFSSRQISELASSLATLEMEGGRKKATQLFEKSLVDPTGNALAQAAWVELSSKFPLFQNSPNGLSESEADAHVEYSKGRFEHSLQCCKEWIKEESFSIRAYRFGAATASVLDLSDEAIELADKGLRIDSSLLGLKLSKAYALAIKGKYFEASSILSKLKNANDEMIQPYVLANEGLIAFRTNRLGEGKHLYIEALRRFKALGDSDNLKIGASYLAREAALANDVEAHVLFQTALRAHESGRIPALSRRVLLTTCKQLGLKETHPAIQAPQEQQEYLWKSHTDEGRVIVSKS
jgi:adenosyl cobinamide kinase/adenosyl cobinamide phosphate guanylyltransferase